MEALWSWLRLWFRGSLREAAALGLATAVLVVSGPLGLAFAELASPAVAAAVVAVTLMSLWGGGRAALLLALGAATSGAVWQGNLPQAAATGLLLAATAHLASARQLALEDERRELQELVRARQGRLRKLEEDLERLSFDCPESGETNRRRVKVAGRSVALLSFAKAVVRPGSRETRLLTTFDTLRDLVPDGRVVLAILRDGELGVVRVAPEALAGLRSRRFSPSAEPFRALLEGLAPLRFPGEILVVEGLPVAAGAALPLGGGQVAVILVGFGSEPSPDAEEAVMDVLRTASAALRMAAGVGARQPRPDRGGAS